MATTFKATVYADNKKNDGTYNVKIRVTHNRQSLKVSTTEFVMSNELTRGLKIKNEEINDRLIDLIRKWRNHVAKLGAIADSMSVKDVVEYIRGIETAGDRFELDFIEYGRKVANSKTKGTCRNYNIALNALSRFIKGHTINISQITAIFLRDFEEFIENEPVMRGDTKEGLKATNKSKSGGRALSLYMGCIRHIHNQAKKDYNDEEMGIIRIPQSPFKYYEMKKEPVRKKRSLQIKEVQAIINLPDSTQIVIKDHVCRRDLARDCFILSFALGGMNAVDLFTCKAQKIDTKHNVIIYNRQKTKTRRDDEAEMRIRIESCIMALMERYKDPTGERLFCFHKLYTSPDVFNSALKEGLKQVEDAAGIKNHFTFYTARHSIATIARSSKGGQDKATVHELLNHVDEDMKVTDIYIERDWSVVWKANAKVLKLFDW